MAILEAAIVMPILLAFFRRKKKRRGGAVLKPQSQTYFEPVDPGFSHFQPVQSAPDEGEAIVPGELEGTIQVGGTGDPEERRLVEHYRLILDETCSKMAIRLRPWDYDKWITMRYWDLRKAGWTDPEEMAADILSMDSPHCEWPPSPDSPPLARYIWDWLYPGIQYYYAAEVGGTLKYYKWKPMPGVIPVVVWAQGYSKQTAS